MSEFIEILSSEAKRDINDLVNKLGIATKEVKELNKNKIDILPSNVETQTKKYAKSIEQINFHQKEAIRLNKAVERQKAKLARANGKVNQSLQKLRFETQQENRMSKQRAIISSKLATAYQKEQAKINILAQRYRELAVRKELNNNLSNKEQRELDQTTRQINRKQAALKKVDANMKVYNRNVGNYRSAWGGVRNMMRSVIGAFGIYSGLEIGRQIFNQIKEIDGLNKALKQVTDSQEDFNQATQFLINLADRSGAAINTLQKAYVKFFASAKQTTLTLRESQEIFDSITIATSLLGASTAETEGALRAVEQMMSKGKIQAEELRGQLGERLAGAFAIVAESMGYTTEELSKQLELGNVYAAEVLPKVAKQLKISYGFDQTTRVETLAAAQGRLTTEWNLFIRDVEEGNGVITKTFSAIFEGVTKAIKAVRILNVSNKSMFEEGKGLAKDYVLELVKGLEGEDLENAIEKSRKNLNKTLLSLRERLSEITKTQSTLNWDSVFNSKELKIEAAALLRGIGQVEESLNLLDSLSQGENIDPELNEEQETKAEESGKKLAEAIKEGIEKADPLAIYDAMVEKKRRIAELNKEIFGGLEKVEELDIDKEINEELEKRLKILEDIAKAKNKADNWNLLKGQLQELGNLLNISVSKIEGFFQTFETNKAFALTSLEVVGGLSQTAFQNEMIRIDNLIQANRERYQREIQLAQGNEKQQEALRREQETKERELLQKRAEAQKKQALFEIAINTAIAIVQALPNLALSAAIAGLGLAQAAIVQSQPIPQYKYGRDGGSEEYAILGDGGKHEPIVDKKGNLKGVSPNKPTLMHLDSGDSVIPSMEEFNRRIYNETMMANVMASKQKKQKDNTSKEVIKALKNAKFINNNISNVDLNYSLLKAKYS